MMRNEHDEGKKFADSVIGTYSTQLISRDVTVANISLTTVARRTLDAVKRG